MLLDKYKWSVMLGISVLLVTSLVRAREPILFSIGNFLIVKEDRLQPSDLIHVLGGGEDRLDYGVQLYKQGYSQRLFFTGSGPTIKHAKAYTSYAQYAETYVVSKGVPQENIVPFDSISTSTYEEALALKQLLTKEQHTIHSVLIVSEPHHMRRVRWTFKKVLGHRVTLQFASVPFEMARRKERWWTDKTSLRIVRDEYLKILFYWVRYQFPDHKINEIPNRTKKVKVYL